MIIDRISDGWATIDDEGKIFNIPQTLLPKGAKEGDSIFLRVEKDEVRDEEKRQEAEDLLKDLFGE